MVPDAADLLSHRKQIQNPAGRNSPGGVIVQSGFFIGG